MQQQPNVVHGRELAPQHPQHIIMIASCCQAPPARLPEESNMQLSSTVRFVPTHPPTHPPYN